MACVVSRKPPARDDDERPIADGPELVVIAPTGTPCMVTVTAGSDIGSPEAFRTCTRTCWPGVTTAGSTVTLPIRVPR